MKLTPTDKSSSTVLNIGGLFPGTPLFPASQTIAYVLKIIFVLLLLFLFHIVIFILSHVDLA